MNPRLPLAIGVAGILTALGTAIANANRVFEGHTQWMYYCYGGAVLLVLLAGVLAFMPVQQLSPRIIATRYGRAEQGTGIHSAGYQAGESGLIFANDGEPGYEIGVYKPFVSFGEFQLHFNNRIARLRKEDGETQMSTWIDSKTRGGTFGSSLFEVMRQHDIDHIKVPVLYKDIKNRWYKTICTIDRDVLHTRDGLLVRSDFRGRAWKPRA